MSGAGCARRGLRLHRNHCARQVVKQLYRAGLFAIDITIDVTIDVKGVFDLEGAMPWPKLPRT
jgi:hypothetical protein